MLAVWTKPGSGKGLIFRKPDDHLKTAGQASNKLSVEARRWLALAQVEQNTAPALRNRVDFDPVNELNKENCYAQLRLWVKEDKNNSIHPLIKLDETGYTFLVRASLASITLSQQSHPVTLCARQINRLIALNPSALKGVVTESGPGPGAPSLGRRPIHDSSPYNPLPLQFKHPTIESDTKLTACFERNRIDGATPGETSEQLHTSAEKWSVSLGQFYAFCEHCFADPMCTIIKNASDERDEGYERKMNLERSMEHSEKMRYENVRVGSKPANLEQGAGGTQDVKLNPGHRVTGYDLERFFVKPWTAGCRHGVALMMNAKPIGCEVMFSHAWGEDMEQLYTMLKLHERSMKTRDEAEKFNPETRIWFCIFGLYQGAGAAPLLAQITYTQTDIRLPDLVTATIH